MENFGLGGDSKKKERCYGYVEIERIGRRCRAHCGLGDRASIGDAGERAGIGGNSGRRDRRRVGCPFRVRALSLLVEAGRLLPPLLQLLCRAAALVLAPTLLVISASVRAVTTPPQRFA